MPVKQKGTGEDLGPLRGKRVRNKRVPSMRGDTINGGILGSRMGSGIVGTVTRAPA